MRCTGRATLLSSKRKALSIRKEMTTITIRNVLVTIRIGERVSVPKYCREMAFPRKSCKEENAIMTIGKNIVTGSICKTSSSAPGLTNTDIEYQNINASPMSPP
jgi:hypothetical protein